MKLARVVPRKSFIAALIFCGSFAVWSPVQLRLANARRTLAAMRIQLKELNGQAAAARSNLEAIQSQVQIQTSDRNQAIAALAKAEKELAKVDPESRWSTPPAILPDWNPESPFVWLNKDMLLELPLSPFTDKGTIRSEIGYVMAVDPATQRVLNAQLERLLKQYRELEVAKAERTEEHLPGIVSQKGEKLTIRVQPQPEEGARLKAEFEKALTDALGEQRAQMLLQTGDSWIQSEFAQFGREPKTISVIRHSRDNYNVSVKSGSSWFSTGGPASAVKHAIPANLRSIFAELFDLDLEASVAPGD